MDLLLCTIVDGVGVVEPAVVGVPLLAVHDGVRSVVGLRQLVPVLHFDQIEVAAVFHARVFLLAGAERPALDTLPEGQGRVNSEAQFLTEFRLKWSNIGMMASHLCYLLVFSTHSWTGRADLTGGTLEFGVGALADAAVTRASAIADLLVAGHTCGVVQWAIAGASSPHWLTDTNSAFTVSMPWNEKN